LLAFLAGSSVLFAQNTAAAPMLSVKARLVVLDVVVTDARGELVTGLKSGDFTILEDGIAQPIHNFTAPADRPRPAASPSVDRYGRQDWGDNVPLTIFVLDELNTPFDEKSFSAANLRRYLLAQPAQLSTPSMLVTVNYTGLNTLAGYTLDRDELLHALGKRPPALPSPVATLELAAQTLAMLRQIALAAQGRHTHSNLVWLGRGFPTLDPADFSDPDAAVLKKAIQDTVDLLVAARITLYQVNPITVDDRMAGSNLDVAIGTGSGLTSAAQATAAGDMLDRQFGFNSFVAETGGEQYYGRNDLDRFIADSTRRGDGYYTLTYVPPQDFKGTAFHSILVVTRDAALHASTRTGFYSLEPPPLAPNLKDLGFDLKLAATGAMQYPSVGVSVAGVSRQGNSLSVKFNVEDRSLSWSPRPDGSEGAQLTVLLVSLDAHRDIDTSTAETLHVGIRSAADVAHGQLQASLSMKLNSKSRKVRLLVRDASGRIGSTDIDATGLSTAH
jgi:VWFA-related protein